jgi:Ca2+-binding EF-hand superfamily protein|eukprot:COSAG01_NODE_64_length_29509_cov_1035.985209_30_plen_292_part_00
MAAATGDGGEGTAPSAPLHKLRGQPAAPEPVGVEHGWEGHPIPEGTEAEQQADGDDAVGPSEKRWPLLGDGDDGSDSRRGGKEPVRVRAAVPPVVGVKNSPGLMGTIGAVKSFLRVRKGRKKLTDTQPLPDGIDLSIPGIADAWAWFQTMDKDGSGHLDLKEVIALLYGLGLDFGRRRMKSVYHDMCSVSPIDGDLGVSFEAFAQWWSRHQAIARRDMRRAIRELFQEADHDKSGILSQEEFKLLVDAANRRKGLPALSKCMAHHSSVASLRLCFLPTALLPLPPFLLSLS